MARPKKKTIDYFPHSCESGRTIFILEQSFGNDGYAFWFKLLELLGKTKNHYLDCRNLADFEFLQAKTRTNEDMTCKILDLLSRLDAIDGELWKNRIIWCQNFVDNIGEVYLNRRVEIPVKPSFYDLKPHNHVSKQDNSDVSTGENPQSKVKESKAKEIKQNGDFSKTEKSLSEKNGFSKNIEQKENEKIDTEIEEKK